MRQIAGLAINGDSTLTPAVHREFSALLEKSRVAPGDFRDKLSGLVVTHTRLLYRDALAARQSRVGHKSAELVAYEQHLVALRLLPESRAKESEAFLREIAAGDSVRIGGHAVLLAEKDLQNALTGLERADHRLDQLFAKP